MVQSRKACATEAPAQKCRLFCLSVHRDFLSILAIKVGQEACEVEGHMALVGLGLKRVLVWHGEIAQTIHHEVEHVGGNTELLTFNPGIRQKTTAAMGTVAGAGHGFLLREAVSQKVALTGRIRTNSKGDAEEKTIYTQES
jgi:hypothetical protein